MPTVMMMSKEGGRTLDARPDRIDIRDLPYRPRLVSLPPQHPYPRDLQGMLQQYKMDQMILDQGRNGACTGFGLAACINYLLWAPSYERRRRPVTDLPDDAPAEAPPKVSERMLYQLARIYDEWEGEDYEGSSCRGAMKGWHRHGVCTQDLWKYEDDVFVPPEKGWEEEAAHRPLGAYYRITKDQVNDMQGAIHEVGAVYVSASIHTGWLAVSEDEGVPPVIRQADQGPFGGHAFALVGYTLDGFIVQNSWGPDWGFEGFAILPYEDWARNGMDAWVAVLGAPVRRPEDEAVLVDRSLRHRANEPSGLYGLLGSGHLTKIQYVNERVRPWSRTRAYQHTIVLGNEGRAAFRTFTAENARAESVQVLETRPREWLAADARNRKLVIYAHGGLNSEDAALKRVRILAPYFMANGVYPLFYAWRTGILETLRHILEDTFDSVLPWRSSGWLEDAAEWLVERKDRSVELAARAGVKPMWTEMKENAAASAVEGHATHTLSRALHLLARAYPDLEVHLVGHSAGSTLLGHLVGLLDRGPQDDGAGGPVDDVSDNVPDDLRVRIATTTLFAPACTVKFALQRFAPSMEEGALTGNPVHVDVMSDERELGDSVGPYARSLLYLVSRALEPAHKTPILGLHAAWSEAADRKDRWSDEGRRSVRSWSRFLAGLPAGRLEVRVHDHKEVHDGQGRIPLAHGSFDNDVEVITSTLRRILGRDPDVPVENLRGY